MQHKNPIAANMWGWEPLCAIGCATPNANGGNEGESARMRTARTSGPKALAVQAAHAEETREGKNEKSQTGERIFVTVGIEKRDVTAKEIPTSAKKAPTMKKLLFFCMLLPLICFPSCSRHDEGDDEEVSSRVYVAIGEWENKSGAPDELFQTLTDRVTNQIVNTRKFRVVERDRIGKLFKKQDAARSEITSDENASALGKIKAALYNVYNSTVSRVFSALWTKPEPQAGYIISGTVLDLGLSGGDMTLDDGTRASKRTARVSIQLRITNAKDGHILASKEVSAIKSMSKAEVPGSDVYTESIESLVKEAIGEAAQKVTRALMELAFPIRIVEIGTDTVTINVPEEQTRVGARYEVFRPGAEIIDPDTGAPLGPEEESVGVIQVVRVKPKVAEAKPLGNLWPENLEIGMIVRPEDPEKVRKPEPQPDPRPEPDLTLKPPTPVPAYPPEPDRRPIVAIGEWENKSGAPDELFKTLINRITNEIVNTGKFQVVERERIRQIIEEWNLQNSGLVKESDAERKLAPAAYSIYGTVLYLGRSGAAATVGDGVTASQRAVRVDIDLRITNEADGRILASKEVSATRNVSSISSRGASSNSGNIESLVNDAIREAAKKVTRALMELAFPIRIVATGKDTVTINVPQEQTNLDACYEVFRPGREMIDPNTGRSLGPAEEYVGRIQVVRVKPEVAEAKPLGSLRPENLEIGMIVRPVDPERVRKQVQQRKDSIRKQFEDLF